MTDKDRWYLQRYFTFSQELEKAYELKEQYFQWFKQAKENGESAIEKTKETLEAFYKKVEEANIPEFLSVVSTYRNWQKEILNSFVFGYSNGFVEGLNNLIKVIKRNAFGFRNFKRLRAKILLNHQYKKIGNEIG